MGVLIGRRYVCIIGDIAAQAERCLSCADTKCKAADLVFKLQYILCEVK